MRPALLLIVPCIAMAQPPAAQDLLSGGALVLGAAAVAPLDARVRTFAQQPSIQSSPALHISASVLNTAAVPGTMVLVAGTYIGGQLTHDRQMARFGLHGGEAIFLGEAFTFVVKSLTGRARPNEPANGPYDFRFGGGTFHNAREALPSGHATAAFATAAVASVESTRWSGHAGWVGPAAYTVAGAMALARVYSNKHWLSDVLAGAGVGLAAGLLVSHFSESHPRNAIDRAFLP
jgi:membrane-associated phospholipid phosphatase